ncbi:MAG: SMC family ATPase [candidate division KSB1 bacterium]|nr:SMC family ATPase [candidate division KSB1 bacterium]
MIIRYLELKNYRRFRQQALEFPENLVGFIGPNGAGKSTLIEAIAWALYGTRAARGSKTDIRSQTAGPREVTEVTLIFEIAGTEYKIVRQLRGKNAIMEAALYRSGSDEPLAVQEKGVNQFVERLIGLDYRSFFASVFARQKDLAALGNMQPEDRRQAINRLINIDAIDRARDLARQRKNQLESELSGMKAMIKDPEALEKEVQALTEQVKKEEEAEALAQKSVQKAKARFDQAKQEFERLSQLRDRYQKLDADMGKCVSEQDATGRHLKDTRAELKKINKSKDDLKALKPHLERHETVKAEKEKLDAQKARLENWQNLQEELKHQQEQAEAERRIVEQARAALSQHGDPEAELKKLEDRQAELDERIVRFENEQKQVNADCTAIEVQGTDLKEKLGNIEKLGQDSPCPVCTRPLGEHYSSVRQHLQSEIQRLRQQWKTANGRRQQLEKDLLVLKDQKQELQKQKENLREAVARLQGERQRLQEAEKRYQQFNARVQELNKKIADLGEIEFDAAEYERVLQEFEKLQKIHERALTLQALIDREPDERRKAEELERRLQQLEGQLSELKKQQEALQYDEKAFQKAKAEYDQALHDYNQVRDTLAEAGRALAAARTRLQNAENELNTVREQIQKTEELETEKRYYEALVEHFGRFRMHLASRLRPLIAARASELLRMTTSGRYSLMELDEEYSIRLVDQGETHKLQRFSGGEQDLANLCLRMAISQVVAERSGKSPVQFIVLDEVFGSQDQDRQQLIMQALLQLQSRFRQIFIISHVEAIKEILPVIIQVELLNAQESRAQML